MSIIFEAKFSLIQNSRKHDQIFYFINCKQNYIVLICTNNTILLQLCNKMRVYLQPLRYIIDHALVNTFKSREDGG